MPLWAKILIGAIVATVVVGAVGGVAAYFIIAGKTSAFCSHVHLVSEESMSSSSFLSASIDDNLSSFHYCVTSPFHSTVLPAQASFSI